MLENLLVAILQFFIQPLFLVGLVYAFWLNQKRMRYERETFQSAIYREYEEVKEYLLMGLLPGLLLSIVAVALGITVTMDWVIIYQIIAIVLLIFGSRLSHPIFTMTLSGGVAWLIYHYFSDSYSNISFIEQKMTSLPADNFSAAAVNWLVLLLLIVIVGFVLLNRKSYDRWTPYYMMSKRGVKVSSYRNQHFYMIPLLLVVPGEAFTAFADWWPVFSIGNESFSFFILPVLFGLRFTAQSHTPAYALNKVNKELLISGGVMLVGLLLGIFVNDLFIWLTFALGLILGIVVLIRHRLHERSNVVIYSPSDNGVRIIGVRPNSPADRLNINVGDVILNVNDIQVNEASEVTQALEKNRSFVYLRLKRFDGEIILESGSLYKDDPYDLGLILLSQDKT